MSWLDNWLRKSSREVEEQRAIVSPEEMPVADLVKRPREEQLAYIREVVDFDAAALERARESDDLVRRWIDTANEERIAKEHLQLQAAGIKMPEEFAGGTAADRPEYEWRIVYQGKIRYYQTEEAFHKAIRRFEKDGDWGTAEMSIREVTEWVSL